MAVNHSMSMPLRRASRVMRRASGAIPVGTDGLTRRERRRSAKRYATAAMVKSPLGQMDAWANLMRAKASHNH